MDREVGIEAAGEDLRTLYLLIYTRVIKLPLTVVSLLLLTS